MADVVLLYCIASRPLKKREREAISVTAAEAWSFLKMVNQRSDDMQLYAQTLGYCLFAELLVCAAGGQQPAPLQPQNSPPPIQVRSNLVLVPALVRNAEGELVYSLTAKDFSVRDNGVEQKVILENEVDPRPLVLVVAWQAGGNGFRQREYLTGLSTMVENIVGNVPHQIALVVFGAKPSLVTEFSSNLDSIQEAFKHPPMTEDGSAILDAVGFSLRLLDEQPRQYRRAILLISETRDHGSKTSQQEIIREIGKSNTAIYSVAFSPAKTQFRDALTGPGGANKPFTYNVFLPPVVAYFNLKPVMDMAINCMRSNAAEEMAGLSGGEYIRFDNKREFDSNLNTIANHLPNRYLLSFQPTSATPGLHVIEVRLKNHPEWIVTARTSYWATDELADGPNP